MIPFLDKFLDTKAKRYHLFIMLCLLVWLALCIPYIVMGIKLIVLESYNSLFSLLKDPWIEKTYIARVILDCISIANIDTMKILESILVNLQFMEITSLILAILAYPILETKKITTTCLLLLLVEVIGSVGCVFMGLKATSLANAVFYIRMIGGLLTIINVVLILVFLYYLYMRIKYIKGAMQITCIEIKEHTDISVS